MTCNVLTGSVKLYSLTPLHSIIITVNTCTVHSTNWLTSCESVDICSCQALKQCIHQAGSAVRSPQSRHSQLVVSTSNTSQLVDRAHQPHTPNYDNSQPLLHNRQLQLLLPDSVQQDHFYRDYSRLGPVPHMFPKNFWDCRTEIFIMHWHGDSVILIYHLCLSVHLQNAGTVKIGVWTKNSYHLVDPSFKERCVLGCQSCLTNQGVRGAVLQNF